MSGYVLDGDKDTPKRLNDLARHQTITRLYNDILIDLAICDIEGWDKMEYLNQILTEIEGIVRKRVQNNKGD